MKYLFITVILLCSVAPFSAEEHNLVDVLSKLEKRFKITLIYSNEVLYLRNGAKATVTFDGSDGKQEELFRLLEQTLGLSFIIAEKKENVYEKHPKKYIVKARQSRLEDHIRVLEREIQSLRLQLDSNNRSIDKNTLAIQGNSKSIEQIKSKDDEAAE